jgi:thiamine biosynthesis lipoprotein
MTDKSHPHARTAVTGKTLLTLLITLTHACTPGSRQNTTYHHDTGAIFSTGYNIKYAGTRSLRDEITATLNHFDQSLNPFKDNTTITKVNRNEPVEPDTLLLKVLRRSQEISRTTGGKFDITISPLINAWGFGFRNMDTITPEIIDSLKSITGYEKISVDTAGNIRKTDPRVQINTSAIAKGYACDIIATLLESHGIENYMIEIGGEITAKGVNDKGECWHIQIDKPIDDITGILHRQQTVLTLCNKSLATSGNNRNYYIKDGKKYAHTIDPLTGYPTQLDILGATVIADDCMTADAYATAFMVMGMEQTIETARKLPELHYYLVYEKPDGTFGARYSDGFEQFFADQN